MFLVPCGGLLKKLSGLQHTRVIASASHKLQSDRQILLCESARYGNGR